MGLLHARALVLYIEALSILRHVCPPGCIVLIRLLSGGTILCRFVLIDPLEWLEAELRSAWCTRLIDFLVSILSELLHIYVGIRFLL